MEHRRGGGHEHWARHKPGGGRSRIHRTCTPLLQPGQELCHLLTRLRSRKALPRGLSSGEDSSEDFTSDLRKSGGDAAMGRNEIAHKPHGGQEAAVANASKTPESKGAIQRHGRDTSFETL